MKPALILAAALLAAAPAAAETANQAATKEARGYLIPCTKLALKYREECRDNQAEFLDTYIRAKAGDDAYILQLIDFFGSHPDPLGAVRYCGIRNDRLQGCAWEVVRYELATEANDRMRLRLQFQADCGDLDADAVITRAGTLLTELRTNPTEPPKSAKNTVEDRCLDSTVCLPGEDCPPVVTPPGCPGSKNALRGR